MALKDLQKL